MFVFTVGTSGLRNIFPVLKFLTTLNYLIAINSFNALVDALNLQPYFQGVESIAQVFSTHAVIT